MPSKVMKEELLNFYPSRLHSVRVRATISTPVELHTAKEGGPRCSYERAIGGLEHVAGPMVNYMLQNT